MDNKSKVLKEIFNSYPDSLHIRLLARKTGLNQNTIINITNKLAEEKIITREKDNETNKVSIKGNRDNPMFLVRRKLFNIERVYESGIVDYLNDSLHYPAIILFGSFAKAENRKGSDIDLFIISDDKTMPDISQFEERLGAGIEVFIHTKKEFNELKKTSKELINNVMNGFILSGYVEVC